MKILDKRDGVTVRSSATLANTPCMKLVLSVYAELLELGWAMPRMPFSNASRVIWAENSDGAVLGGICYDFVQNNLEAFINLSFTAPEHRGGGVNALCHEFLEQECRKNNINTIGSVVHTQNAPRLKSAAKVGLNPDFYRMVKILD